MSALSQSVFAGGCKERANKNSPTDVCEVKYKHNMYECRSFMGLLVVFPIVKPPLPTPPQNHQYIQMENSNFCDKYNYEFKCNTAPVHVR